MATTSTPDRVETDSMSGARSGVAWTPTLYIDGLRHDESHELDELLDALERAAEDRWGPEGEGDGV
jgi:hypothetical protein